MSNYIDGFVLPIPRKDLAKYQAVASKVAEIWKEHGALSYSEYVGDDLKLEGTRSFIDSTDASEQDVIIFGWVIFESREMRDLVNERIAADSRMADLVAPIVNPSNIIFDAKRMVYGGFKSLV